MEPITLGGVNQKRTVRQIKIAEKIRYMRKLDTATGCILWQGIKKNRYGWINLDGKSIGAHRAVWELYYGPIPKGYLVCHRCDTPACTNIEHLFLGTHKDNMQDMASKHRQNYHRNLCIVKDWLFGTAKALKFRGKGKVYDY